MIASNTARRHGYSLTVVLLFLVLLLGIWAVVYRTTASFLRLETALVKRNDLDAALAQALWYLEKNPTLPRVLVTYGVKVPPCDQNGRSFIATFNPIVTSQNQWTIQVAPGTYPTPLPGCP